MCGPITALNSRASHSMNIYSLSVHLKAYHDQRVQYAKLLSSLFYLNCLEWMIQPQFLRPALVSYFVLVFTLLASHNQWSKFQYSVVHWSEVWYSAVQYISVQPSAVQFSAVPYIAEQWISAQCSAVQCSAVQCSAVQCSAVQCSTVQCSAVQCSAVKFSAVQCSAVQCSWAQLPGTISIVSANIKSIAGEKKAIWQWNILKRAELFGKHVLWGAHF